MVTFKMQTWHSLYCLVNGYPCDRGYIIDACSLERNWVLVNSYFVGGSNERQVPPHYITEVCTRLNKLQDGANFFILSLYKVSEEYQWPLFDSLPPPSVYWLPAQRVEARSSQLTTFLSGPLPNTKENGWDSVTVSW